MDQLDSFLNIKKVITLEEKLEGSPHGPKMAHFLIR